MLCFPNEVHKTHTANKCHTKYIYYNARVSMPCNIWICLVGMSPIGNRILVWVASKLIKFCLKRNYANSRKSESTRK